MIKNNKIPDKLFLFILNPFLSAICSLKNIRDGVSHHFLYLWFLVFGASFIANNEMLDSIHYYEQFLVEKNYSVAQYMSYIRDYFTFNSEIKDIYTLTINFLVGRFTDNYHWIFFIYSGVFGLFYIKSLKIFLRYKIDSSLVFYALLFMFCFNNPIFNINGVRFWTAAWIGIYSTLSIVIEKDYKKAFYLFLVPLIHGSFYIWIGLLVISFILRKFTNICIAIFILSSFVSAVSYINILDNYTYLLPPFLQRMVYGYTQAERAIRIMNGESSYGEAYADILNSLPGYLSLLMSYILIWKRKTICKNAHIKNVFFTYLALGAMTNFLSGIPSLGRFQSVTYPLLFLLWTMNYKKLAKYNKIFYMVPIAYAYSILYWYRRTLWVVNISTFIMPAPLTLIINLL